MRSRPGSRPAPPLCSYHPGYHLNKRHWNTVALDGSLPDQEVLELVNHSYDLVLAGLTRTQRNKLIT